MESSNQVTGTARVKRGLAEMLKGGVIMDVVTADQAKIAEEAGAVAVMALERVPADIRAQGGVARMSDPELVHQIMDAVTIPVMAKARIGHFVEAQVLQAIGVDYVDESEVLSPADEAHHVDKWQFTVPFVCGATNLGEALRRIAEGAAMIRSKGEAGTGNVIEAVRHMRAIAGGIRRLHGLRGDELFTAAKELAAPYELVTEVAAAGHDQAVHGLQLGRGADLGRVGPDRGQGGQVLADVALVGEDADLRCRHGVTSRGRPAARPRGRRRCRPSARRARATPWPRWPGRGRRWSPPRSPWPAGPGRRT